MAETTAGHHTDPSEPEPHPPKGHPKLDPLPDTSDKVNEEAVARFNTTQNSEKRNARSAGLFIAGLVIVAALWAWDPVTWWKSQDAPPTPSQAGAPTAPPAPNAQAAVFCGPGSIGVNGQCVPKGASPPVQPAAVPAAPAPAASPSPGIAAGTVTVCDKNRKEVMTDYQLIGGGIALRLFNPARCKSSLTVKSGTIRVTYRDNSQKDFTPATCPTATTPGCAVTVPPVAIASVTPSSIITLEVEPVR
jgi:hypothetical protein